MELKKKDPPKLVTPKARAYAFLELLKIQYLHYGKDSLNNTDKVNDRALNTECEIENFLKIDLNNRRFDLLQEFWDDMQGSFPKKKQIGTASN